MTDGPDASTNAAEAPALTAAEVARLAAHLFVDMSSAVLVLEVPSERIVAATPTAARLIDPDGSMIIGHLFEEFTADSPALGFDMFAGARLNGFETVRMLLREAQDDLPVRIWIRPFDGQPSSCFVAAIFVPGAGVAPAWAADPSETSAIVGTADSRLLIERISSDAEQVFQRSVTALLGVPLLSLVAREDVPQCLAALSTASENRNGVALAVTLRAGPVGERAQRCEMVIMPLEPSPSCAFILLPVDGENAEHDAAGLASTLQRVRRGAEVAQLVDARFQRLLASRIPGLGRLTTRELEIVSRLLDGDRPPAIARSLFLSQSTVRNHLSSVFGKLGVSSQQELLHAVRDA